MGRKPRHPRKITALLKVGVGAADAEYARVLEHWYFLLGASKPRLIFKTVSDSRRNHSKRSFKMEFLDGRSIKRGESYLIIEAISGTFVGIISGVRVRTLGGRLPVPGRIHYLIKMGRT